MRRRGDGAYMQPPISRVEKWGHLGVGGIIRGDSFVLQEHDLLLASGEESWFGMGQF